MQVDGRQLVAFKIQILCRDWPAQQNRRESFRCSVLPRGELPLPRIQNFWRRYRMRLAGRLTARFVPLQFRQEGHAGHFGYSLTVKKLHGHQLCARPKFQPPNMAQQYVVVPSFTPPLRASKTP